jgi:uncharacterized protein (TIGR01777 family)
MSALLTGATGFLGPRLVQRLRAAGEAVSLLSRNPAQARARLGEPGQPGSIEAHAWDPAAGPPPLESFTHGGAPVGQVIHLLGEPVAEGRWTADKKRRIHDSRVIGTRHLVSAIEALPAAARPKVLVSASAVGYYGDRGDELLDEQAAPGSGFLPEVCVAWEREAERAAALGLRVVRVRIGIVLGEGGGALARMLTPFRLGAGGRLGSGRQFMPWIHADDVVGVLLHAAGHPGIRGALNAVGPAPVRNADFTSALGAVLHRPAVLPVPVTALRLLFGELAQVLLSSQRVVPRVATESGYRFAFPTLEGALASAVGSGAAA